MENINNTSMFGIRGSEFVFTLDRFKDVSYLSQAVAIPGVSFGRAVFQTPVQDLNYPGDKLTFDDLSIEFALDANLQNYTELYGWLRGLAFTESRDDYAQFIQKRAKEIGSNTKNRILEETSIANLTVVSPTGKPTFRFVFLDVFPVALSPINFDTQDDGSEYLKCTATFSFNYFNIERVNETPVDIFSINNPNSTPSNVKYY